MHGLRVLHRRRGRRRNPDRRSAGAEDLTSTRAERRAKRPPVRVAVASAAPSLSMRKRDVRWLALAADAGGCRWNKCVTAFMRLRKLGFVEDRSEPSGPQDQFSVVAHITPAGADALARALRVMGGAA